MRSNRVNISRDIEAERNRQEDVTGAGSDHILPSPLLLVSLMCVYMSVCVCDIIESLPGTPFRSKFLVFTVL